MTNSPASSQDKIAASWQNNGSVQIAAQACDISVIVPVMNEQGNIRPLIDETVEALQGRDFEIIYINDGSDDGSAEELAQAQADLPMVRVLTHQKRAGQSAAIRSGLPVHEAS